jgi:tetratricopeptide (TPR) repeat protein
MGDIDSLLYFHTKVFSAITRALSIDKKTISVFSIGGGGYVFPQYIEKNWPGSRNDVAEIDPGVTKAATAAFGLKKETSINTITMDARNYVDDLLEQKKQGKDIPAYNFIYEDAFSDYNVPFQLVTKEFNDKINTILTDDGAYMINMIDVLDIGQFLGSYIHTLRQTFPHIYVLTEKGPRNIRSTFVITASRKPIKIHEILGDYILGSDIQYIDDAELEQLKCKSNNLVFTDDYVPVENMLAPVVRRSATDILAGKCKEQAEKLKKEGHFEESIEKYKEVVDIDPTLSVLGYNEIAMMLAQNNKSEQAIDFFQKAIDYNSHADSKINIAGIHLNLALVLRESHPEKEKEQLTLAVQGFKDQLNKEPKSLKTIVFLATALQELGDYQQAGQYFQKAIDLNPYDTSLHISLAKTYVQNQQYDTAIATLEKAIGFFRYIHEETRAKPMNDYLEFIKFKKSQPTSNTGK